jgi:ribonuclease HI
MKSVVAGFKPFGNQLRCVLNFRKNMDGTIKIYTDGACRGNPGPGGYGVILLCGSMRKELSGGFRKTTNNRMELLACIEGLRSLMRSCTVVLTSDSKYVVNAMEQGWAKRWRSNGWRLSPSKPAKNSDLWKRLLDLCEEHRVSFQWVKGHNEHPENERCDELAVAASQGKELPADTAFENRVAPLDDLFSF